MNIEIKLGKELVEDPNKPREEFRRKIIWPALRNTRLLNAFAEVDRKDFIPHDLLEQNQKTVYTDEVIELGDGSSISQPSLVALMIDHLDLSGRERVLEIGTGSLYTAVVMAKIAGEVHTIDINPRLTQIAEQKLKDLGIENINIYTGDGLLGLPEHAPFDRIIVTGALKEDPKNLLDQLAEGGVIVMPEGPDSKCLELKVGIKEKDRILWKVGGDVNFHPIMSEEPGGWTDESLAEALEVKKFFIKKLAEVNNMSEEESLIAYYNKSRNAQLTLNHLNLPGIKDLLTLSISMPAKNFLRVRENMLEEQKEDSPKSSSS